MDFVGAVRKQIHDHMMAPAGARLLVAVSGGPDSMALLEAFRRLRPALRIEIGVAHVDHGLRRSSRRDAAFVRAQARRLGLPFHLGRVAVGRTARRRGRSIEDAARALRYGALAAIARRRGYDRIATGHTASDQAETVLMRVVAGTGLDGLSGVLPVREESGVVVVRPLLSVTRRDVEAFVATERIPFVIDETNTDTAFDRNRIRHEIIPLLEKLFNPAVVAALCRLAENARVESESRGRRAAAASTAIVRVAGPGRVQIDRAAFNALDVATRFSVLDMALRGAAAGARFDRKHLAAVVGRAAGAGGTSFLDLPGRIRATVSYGSLVFQAPVPRGAAARPASEIIVPGPGEYDVPWFGNARFTFGPRASGTFNASFDIRVHRYPFVIRPCRPGDRIGPPLYPHTKKVHDVFVDAKVPREARAIIPLVCKGDAVLWVVSRTHPRPATDPRYAIRVSLEVPADEMPEVLGG